MDKPSLVLVYGGTGAQGAPIARRLTAAGHAVRSLTRTRVDLSSAGQNNLVHGDLDDVESLAAASRGCRSVVLLLPLGFDVDRAVRWTEHAVRAAETAGVERFVFNTSGPTPAVETGVAAVDIKVHAERIVRASGLPWVIVRPTLYLGNLTAPWSVPAIVKSRTIAYPLPAELPVNWTTWENVADIVAWAVGEDAAPGQTVDVGGFETATGTQLAQAFTTAFGESYAYAPIPLQAFEAGLNQSLGEPVGTEIARLYAWLAGDGRELLKLAKDQAPVPGVTETRPIASWVEQQDWSRLAEGA
jgi:NAD(P)H dehydrogenase (quinone)